MSSPPSRRERSACCSPLEHDEIPDLRLPALPLSFDRERATHAPPRLPSVQHSAEILGEIGYSEDGDRRARLGRRHSYAIASSGLSFAARRAGKIAAMIPTTIAAIEEDDDLRRREREDEEVDA